MIGSFSGSPELLEWARERARVSRDEYVSDGALVALGYAMAMEDVASSLVRAERIPASVTPLFPEGMAIATAAAA